MTELSASWRVALRVGRRDALRSKGRSLLVAIMVGTPVLLTVMLSTLIASNDVSWREGLPDEMGTAQATATYGGTDVQQSPDGRMYGATGNGEAPTTAQQVADLEKASGAAVLVVEHGYSTTVVVGDRGYRSDLLAVDASNPVTTGMYAVDDGHVPRAANEVLVTKALARHGATIGSTVTVDDTSLNVVGIGRIGTVARGGDPAALLVLPGALDTAAGEESFLIDRRNPVTWADVKALNTAGFVVVSRHVVDHPPPASELYPEMGTGTSGDDAAARAVMVIVVTAIVLEVVLLAGPAFAVGVRRQRRDLALLAATGASPTQVRRVVLGQALVLGVMSCLVGAALGIGLAALVVWLGPSLVPKLSFGPFELRGTYIAAAVVLGSLASMTAALVPARQASKQDVAAVLAGRRGTVRASRGWPFVGIALIALGLFACFTRGTRPGGETMVAASTIAMVLGTVLLTPVIIGAVARVGAVLPLPLRLALRDTARQRARSAPAIAAVMASVAGITTLATGSASDFEQNRQEYSYGTSPGRMTISADAEHLDDAMALASTMTGGIRFTALGRAGSDTAYVEVAVPDTDQDHGNGIVADVYVADAATLAQWGIRLDRAEKDTLAGGGALVSDDRLITDGGLGLIVDDEETGDSDTIRLAAMAADLHTGSAPQGRQPELSGAVVSPATADAHDLPWSATEAISEVGAPVVSSAVEKKTRAAVRGLTPDWGDARVERGFQESYGLPFFALLGCGTLAVLIGTMTATGLALSDARPDFSTLAAVGAAPRTRRLVAGSQAIVLAILGTLLGIAVGFGPGIAVTWPLTSASYVSGYEEVGRPVIAIPWTLLAIIAVVVPLVAALVALVFTRSRLPVVRRLAQ